MAELGTSLKSLQIHKDVLCYLLFVEQLQNVTPLM